MTLVFTQWSNEDGRVQPDWQVDNCPLYDAGCSNAYSKFSNISIKNYGSNEDPNPTPDPEPTPPEPTPPEPTSQFQEFIITVDGTDRTKYIRSQDWSTATATGKSLRVGKNNNVFLQDMDVSGPDYAFSPLIRGGSIEYDIDLSWNDCGCVSGFYLVAGDNLSCH